jgi:class 3 adenylate cyclase
MRTLVLTVLLCLSGAALSGAGPVREEADSSTLREIARLTRLQEVYLRRADSLEHLRRYRGAYEAFAQFVVTNEELMNKRKISELGRRRMQMELDERMLSDSLEHVRVVRAEEARVRRQRSILFSITGVTLIISFFLVVVLRQRERIARARRYSDRLLLNILPAETARELKATGTARARRYDEVTVMFTDFKDFTRKGELLGPEELVEEINHCYSGFDAIIARHGIERIKTIGDSYMCAGGLPVPNLTHPADVVRAALEIQAFMAGNNAARREQGLPYFELRVGVHTGAVVAGIVGTAKFAFDIWGDTVNTASRMESSGEAGRVNISRATFDLVRDRFACEYRGRMEVRNKGEMEMYYVTGELNNTSG